MSNYQPSPEFEDKLRAASAAPGPEAAFANRLRSQLLVQSAAMKPAPKRFPGEL